MDYHAEGKWFIHGPKHRKENQLLSLKHPCWLSIVWHVNLRSMATGSVRYSKNEVRGQKHPREVVINRNSLPKICQYITSKYCQHPVWDYQCPRRASHHRPSLPPSANTLGYVRYQGSKYTVIYIYTRTNYHKGQSQTRGRQEETYCASHKFWCLLLPNRTQCMCG